MAQDDSYEIIPHQLLADLKAEVSVLKEKLMGPDQVTHELVASMHELQASISSMQKVFEDVIKDVNSGDDDADASMHKQIVASLDELKEQNEQIAKGMVAIADLVEKATQNLQHAKPMQAPPMSHQGMQPPAGMMHPPAGKMPPPRPRPPVARVMVPPKQPMPNAMPAPPIGAMQQHKAMRAPPHSPPPAPGQPPAGIAPPAGSPFAQVEGGLPPPPPPAPKKKSILDKLFKKK